MKPKSQELYELALEHFNEPVLLGDRLVRLVGYGEDEMDCYFICISKTKDREKFWHTCVGGYVFLDRLRGQNEVVSVHSGDIWDDLYRLEQYLPEKYTKFELVLEPELNA